MALATVGVPRELGTLGFHPGLEVCQGGTHGDPLLGEEAVDLALDVEDQVDALDWLEGKRPNGSELAACLSGHVGEHEETCAGRRAHASLGDRPFLASRFVEAVEPGIGIGLKDPAIALQMALRVLGGAITRVEEHGSRRRTGVEGGGRHEHRPKPGRSRSGLWPAPDGLVIAMHARAGEDVRSWSGRSRAAQPPTWSANVERLRSTPSRA